MTDATGAIYRLSVRLQADYLNGGHVSYFIPDLNDMATIADYFVEVSETTIAYAEAAAANYALQVALGGGAYAVGTQMLSLPRVANLGSGAFIEANVALGLWPVTKNTTYTIEVHDFRKVLLCTSGTNTWTLPEAQYLPDGWFCCFINRSGNNLTINRGGTDTFNAAATTLAVASAASPIHFIIKTSSSTFEVL